MENDWLVKGNRYFARIYGFYWSFREKVLVKKRCATYNAARGDSSDI
jgi:hypothetical protein